MSEKKRNQRIVRILCLAAMLALCLLLTGCYNAPDDVNSAGPTGTANSFLFNTIAPTATVEVTPDTVVIETQNIFDQGIGTTAAPPTPTLPLPSLSSASPPLLP